MQNARSDRLVIIHDFFGPCQIAIVPAGSPIRGIVAGVELEVRGEVGHDLIPLLLRRRSQCLIRYSSGCWPSHSRSTSASASA